MKALHHIRTHKLLSPTYVYKKPVYVFLLLLQKEIYNKFNIQI
jgi:hypothetical protein